MLLNPLLYSHCKLLNSNNLNKTNEQNGCLNQKDMKIFPLVLAALTLYY